MSLNSYFKFNFLFRKINQMSLLRNQQIIERDKPLVYHSQASIVFAQLLLTCSNKSTFPLLLWLTNSDKFTSVLLLLFCSPHTVQTFHCMLHVTILQSSIPIQLLPTQPSTFHSLLQFFSPSIGHVMHPGF